MIYRTIASIHILAASILINHSICHAEEERGLIALGYATHISLGPSPQQFPIIDGDDIIVTSNSCGEQKTQFNILNSTTNISAPYTSHDSIGEWCKPVFNYNKEYFLAIKGGEIIISHPIFYTYDEAYPVIFIDQDDLDYIRKETNLSLTELEIDVFQDYVIHTDYKFSNDEKIKSLVQDNNNLEIKRIDNQNEVIIIRGVMLNSLFPEIGN